MKLVKLLLMFLFVGVLRSQTHQTEIIPYRLVPSQAEGYGCWLEIEFIGLPQSMIDNEELMDTLQRLVVSKETGEIGFHERDFTRGGKQYVLVKIQVPSPYDVLPKETIIEVDEWNNEED